MNSIYVTAWPEEHIWSLGGSWSEDKVGALVRRVSPSFKIVEFAPELTEEDKEKGVAFFKVNLHKEGIITFDKSPFKVIDGMVDEIEGVTESPHLYIVADVEDDKCFGKWFSRGTIT